VGGFEAGGDFWGGGIERGRALCRKRRGTGRRGAIAALLRGRKVPNTAQTKPVHLDVVAPAHTADVVVRVHLPAPRARGIVLRGAPPAATVADTVESATPPEAAGQSRKAVVIRAVTTTTPTARRFQPRSCYFPIANRIRQRPPLIMARNMPANRTDTTVIYITTFPSTVII